MTAADLSLFLDGFHLLRPWVMLVAIPVIWAWLRLRRQTGGGQAPRQDWLAPHLQQALTVPGHGLRWLRPVDVAALGLLLLTLAASGPAWTREPAPFAVQTAPLVIALQVTPSMLETDLPPDRLTRARHKITDLLARRVGARTALVAYAGSAHVVVPMTEDPSVMQPYLEGLTPEVMPVAGQDTPAALALAQRLLEREDTPGGVLFLLDALSTADSAALTLQMQLQEADLATLGVLFLAPEATPLPPLPDAAVATRITAGTADLLAVERALASAYRRAQLADDSQPWQDRGIWFAWPAALLLLVWFRRGMEVRPLVLTLLALLLTLPGAARAEGWRDWFLTPDQQGWRAYERKDYAAAAAAFQDPYLRGVALYRQGQYETAAAEMVRLQTADAAFLQGMAHLKSRGYRDGVRAFERALALDPTHAGAQQNLPIARAIVAYVETARAQSDTGEDSGIGADDVVFDNETGRGADTTVATPTEDTPAHLSTEQWMRAVDTRTADFLRQRFRLEAAQGTRP